VQLVPGVSLALVEVLLTLLESFSFELKSNSMRKKDKALLSLKHHISAVTPSGSATIPLDQNSMKLHAYF
jgi:hypothetical protein